MRLSRAPDLGAPRQMALVALAVSLIAAVILVGRDVSGLQYGLGDTDDAMRLFMVRNLAAGQGWWDQLQDRMQPPHGVYMHWSRLIDGGVAGLMGLFRLGLNPREAEMAGRIVWPMLWILPTGFAMLAISRRLAGGAAVFACAILMLTELTLYLQFRPGRIDHHGPQIAMAMLALAGAASGRVRGALLAGAASGLGIAIGLEALVFEVLVGGFFAVAFLMGRDDEGRRLRAYATSLGLSTLVFFLIQTPPWRWGVVACDAIGANLVGAIVVAAVGLVAATAVVAERDWRWRFGALAIAGLLAAAVYAGLDPNCLGGPFADVDARLKTFWLPHVQEIRPIPRVWRRDHDSVFSLVAPFLFGAAAFAWLARDRARRADLFFWLAGVAFVAAVVMGWSAIRMATYANWIAVPLIAAAVVDLCDRYLKGAMLAVAVGCCAATPVFSAEAASWLDKQLKPKPEGAAKPAPKPAVKGSARVARGDICFRNAQFAPLAKLPAGLVLSEIDMGPFVLANTPSSVLAAPYHRMNWGLVVSRAVMSTEAEAAEPKARALGVDYVLECRTHGRNADRSGMPANSLQKRLDRGEHPSWLEPVSTAGPLRLYRVRPAGA